MPGFPEDPGADVPCLWKSKIGVEARDDMRGLLKSKINIFLLAEARVDMLSFWDSKMEGLVAEARGGMVGFWKSKMEGLQVEARVERRGLSKSKIMVGFAVPESKL